MINKYNNLFGRGTDDCFYEGFKVEKAVSDTFILSEIIFKWGNRVDSYPFLKLFQSLTIWVILFL